jgi:hypothetical protein
MMRQFHRATTLLGTYSFVKKEPHWTLHPLPLESDPEPSMIQQVFASLVLLAASVGAFSPSWLQSRSPQLARTKVSLSRSERRV